MTSLSLTVPNDVITSLSNFGIGGTSPAEWQFLFLGKANGNLHRFIAISDQDRVEQSTIFEVLTRLGVPNDDILYSYYPPSLDYHENSPIVKNWAHAVDSRVYGFVTSYNAYYWKI